MRCAFCNHFICSVRRGTFAIKLEPHHRTALGRIILYTATAKSDFLTNLLCFRMIRNLRLMFHGPGLWMYWPRISQNNFDLFCLPNAMIQEPRAVTLDRNLVHSSTLLDSYFDDRSCTPRRAHHAFLSFLFWSMVVLARSCRWPGGAGEYTGRVENTRMSAN